MRNFRHLNNDEITEIVMAFTGGESQASLAKRFSVDHSTIHYHVNKFDRSYPEQGGIYAVLKTKVRKECHHPSSRCTLCGTMRDEFSRIEREQIRKLTIALKDAHSRLRVAGLFVE